MKLLGNSSRGLFLLHKCLLYCTCILPIALYRFQLWYYKNTPIKYHIHELSKLQQQTALWITSAFKTSLSKGIKGIADLIPIALHLPKLAGRSHLRYSAIPTNHAISSLLEHSHTSSSIPHRLALSNLMLKQKAKLKSPIISIGY